MLQFLIVLATFAAVYGWGAFIWRTENTRKGKLNVF
jgi:hypothetical protein